MTPPRSVDVLIVSFNTREVLRDALLSLREHLPPPESIRCQISVLDNGSRDGSAEMVAADFPEHRLIRSAQNLGFAAANNELAAGSDADFLLLLNSDVLITQDVITPLLSALQSDEAILAVGPRLVFPDGRVQHSAQRLPSLSYEISQVVRGTRLGRALSRWWDSQHHVDAVHEVALSARADSARRAEFLWATCWLLRRSDVQRDGLFDTSFPMYDEDLDFCRRARDRGRSLLYVPSVELVHLGGASSTTSARKLELMRQARRHYYQRSRGRLRAALYEAALGIAQALVQAVAAVPRPRPRQGPKRS